jgi:hypothetical protein
VPVRSGAVENFIFSLVLFCFKDRASVYLCKKKLIFKAPHQVGTSDMSVSNQTTRSSAGSIGGHTYEVLHSQAGKIVCRV